MKIIMDYVLSNKGALNAHNSITVSTPYPPCECWNCGKSDKVVFRDLVLNKEIIAYCSRCDTQFNVQKEILKKS